MILEEVVMSGKEGWIMALYGLGTVIVMRITMLLSTMKSRRESKANQEKLVAEMATNGSDTSIKDVVNKTFEVVKGHVVSITRIEEKLEVINAQARGRTELALDQSQVAQFMCDEKGLITYANDAMSEMFGLGKNQLLKNKWLVAVEAQNIREEIIRRIVFSLEKGLLFSMNDIIIKNQRIENKMIYNVKITIEPTHDSKGNFMWNLGKIREIK